MKHLQKATFDIWDFIFRNWQYEVMNLMMIKKLICLNVKNVQICIPILNLKFDNFYLELQDLILELYKMLCDNKEDWLANNNM